MTHSPTGGRYDAVTYRQCNWSGLVLPPMASGTRQNCAGVDLFETGRAIGQRVVDEASRISTLATRKVRPYGSFEENFGKISNLTFVGL